MSTNVIVIRNGSTPTFQVHIESGDPPKQAAAGLSLNLARLKVELEQHGCPEETITKALHDLESSSWVTLLNCGELRATAAAG